MAFKLRDYQENGIQACVDILNSKKQCREVVVAPTGAGKSIYLAELAKRYDGPLLILQPSAVLLKQNYEKFIKVGGKASMCCASLKTKTIKGVDYTEVDGELVRCREISKVTFGTAGTVIKYIDELKKLGVKALAIDEVHLMTKSSTHSVKGRTVEKQSQIKKLAKKLGVKNMVGVTASPLYLTSSMSGAELKIMTRVRWKLFTDIRFVTQISELVANKYWTPLLYQINETDDTVLVHNTSGSDYTVESLNKFYKSNDLEGQVVEQIKILRKEGRKSIIVFVPSIEEANNLHKAYPDSAIVHSKMNDKVKNDFIDAFKNLEVPVVFNVNILSVGFDHPGLDAIITCRPTSSIAVFYQQIGRGVRLLEGKKDCKVIDFSGNVSKFGKVEELTFENIPYYGWALLNGKDGSLLTNFPIKAKHRPTRETLIKRGKGDLRKKENLENPEITFGMYKGRRFFDVAKDPKDSARFKNWSSWIYERYKKGEWTFSGSTGKGMIKALEEYLMIEKQVNKLPF